MVVCFHIEFELLEPSVGCNSNLDARSLLISKEEDPLLKDMSNGYGENYDGMDQSLGVPSEKYGSTTSVQEVEVDSGERRLNELGYKQELRREMVNPHSIGNLGCNICMCT